MASTEPVTPDTELVLDAFPLPPAANMRSINSPAVAVLPSPPKGLDQYQTKALPPLPPKFKTPAWGSRSSSLVPAPLSIKSSRPNTPQPTPSSPQALAVQRPRTASSDVRMSTIEREAMGMTWVEPTKSLGESTYSNTPSLTDTSRDTSIDSRPDSFQHTLPTIDEPMSPTSKRIKTPATIRTGDSTTSPLILFPQPRKSARKILSLTGSNPVFTNTPGFLSPTGHNSATKIKKLFGIETGISDSVPISPISSVARHPPIDSVSTHISEPDLDRSYAKDLLDARPGPEAWVGPSPTLPPVEVGESLGFSTENFKLPGPADERQPSALQFDVPHPVRDLYHFSVLKISEEKAIEDGMKTTVIEVGKTKQKTNRKMIKSPAQYSFFPRNESFSARRRNSAALGNRKLPPAALVPKPGYIHGRHPIKTPFPDGSLPLPTAEPATAGLSTAGLSSAGLSTPGFPGGSAPPTASMIEGADTKDVPGVDEIYRSQPASAFDLDEEEEHKSRSFLSDKRLSALSHVFKRHSGTASSTSKEDKRRSKDSFASIGSHGFFKKPPPRHIIPSTPPKAVVTTTIGTPERASSFTSTESAGWFGAATAAGASTSTTANTTPASASAMRFSNPFSRSSTPLPGDRSETDVDDEGSSNTAPGEKKSLKMKLHASSLRLPRSSSSRKSRSPSPSPPDVASPGRIGARKSASTRDGRSAERRRNSMKNKIRIVPEGEAVEPGVPSSVVRRPVESKRSSMRLSAHPWR